MKACRNCGETKPLTEYYRHPRMADGHLNECKECRRAYMRRRHSEKMRDPAWRDSERARSREKYREHGDRWAGPDPQKRTAHRAVNNAVRDGRLIPADRCEDCGHDFSTYRREGHHEDYGKPLDVAWLCALCHGKRHRSAA